MTKHNDPYCKGCSQGFYPLDPILKFPTESEVTEALEKRLLDVTVYDVYTEAAEPIEMHDG